MKININTIFEILNKARFFIANYIKNVYVLEDISIENNADRYSLDESHFLMVGNEQMRIIGIIHNSNKDFRLEVSKLRN